MSSAKKPKDNPASIYVVFIKNGRLETYTFSTIENAQAFTKNLSRDYVILVGHLATDVFKESN